MNAAADPRDAALRRRQVLAGAWLTGLAAAVAWATPRRDAQAVAEAPLAALAPPRIGPWRVLVGAQDVVPQTLDEAEAVDRTLLRSFAADGLPSVMMATSYHSAASRDVKVHRPEVCYENGGFRLSNIRNLELRLSDRVALPARAFTAVRGTRTEQVLYWSRVAADFPQDLTEQRLAMIRYGLRGAAADGLLMRFSLIGGATPARMEVLATFARLLFASADPAARRLMVGQLAASAVA